jgi:membrane fusion protein (multidrug efflux system)
MADTQAYTREQEPDGKTRAGAETSRPHQLWQRTPVKILLGVVVIAVVAGGVYYWWLGRGDTVSTSDAFVDTTMVNIAPRVAGQVIAVPVAANASVNTGTVLVRIDPTVYQAQLEQAKAQLTSAEAQVKQAEANSRSAEADARNANQQLQRSQTLRHDQSAVISQQQLDQAIAANNSAQAKVAAAAQSIDAAKAQVQVAQAAVHTASLNVDYTTIPAPQPGTIANLSVAVGDYVAPGQALMALVPKDLWVTANFKETAIDGIRPGQPATVAIDACGGRKVTGRVVSIQRGAGQAFQILPPENATGNFVKVVQRVPVRIALDAPPANCIIGPGMSVEPSINLKPH